MDAQSVQDALNSQLGQNARNLLRWAIYSAVLAIAAMVLSVPFQTLLGYSFGSFAFSEYVSPAVTTVVFFTSGIVLFGGAAQELKAKRPSTLALVCLASIILFVSSAAATIGLAAGLPGIGADLWWQLAAVIFLALIGRWLEVRFVQAANNSMPDLLALLPAEAEQAIGDQTKKVDAADLAVGDIVVVRPDARVPADGVVIQGNSSIDESLVTGATGIQQKGEGDRVFAGSQNSSAAKRGKGALTVRITAVGSDLLVAAIMRHVEDAKSNLSKVQLRANTSALWLFYSAVFAAAATFVFWFFVAQGNLVFVIERVSAVLLVAAPATMAISIPMVALWTTSTAARAGLLVRQNLDAATKVQVLALGKTGVLTTGKFTVESISVSQGATVTSADELLSLAAAAERKSQHAIAVAVGEAARLKNLSLSPATNVQSISGVGVMAQIDGRQVAVGGPAMLNRLNTQVSYDDLLRATEANENGFTAIFVVVDDVLCGQIQLADQIRDGAADALRELTASGIDVCLVTGDATGVASFVAKQVGVEKIYAEVHPDRKLGIVKQLQADGIRVGFVGDSIDDASALAQADVGIAFGAGSDVSIESAGLVLINADPMSIPRAFTLAKRSLSKRRQNLAWTLGFSVVTLALAAGALAPIGLLVSPVASVVLVSLSTVIVAANGQLLRR